MKNLKKTLVMVVSLALVAALAIGGTVAYLTVDPQKKSNVFTVGDIDITLSEEVTVHGAGSVTKTDDGATYENVMPGDYLKKEVTVENTGENPAYVAVNVTLNNAAAISAAIDDVYEEKYGKNTEEVQAMYDFIFDGWGINYMPRKDAGYDYDDARGIIDEYPDENVLQVDFTKTITDYWLYGATNWFHGADESANKYWIDSVSAANFGGGYYAKNMAPNHIGYTYYLLLEPGESSTLFKGFNVPAAFNAEQLKMFDGLTVNVKASAIQADNMAIAEEYKNDANGKAKTAFAILAGEIETPEYSNKPTGTITKGLTGSTSIWGESTNNAKESMVVKIYSGDTYMGETSLNNVDGIIDGDLNPITWNIALDAASNTDPYWNMSWEKAPTVTLQPTKVELWVDGEKTAENTVKLNNSGDDLAPVTGMVTDSNGYIVRYLFGNETPELGDGESLVPIVDDNTELSDAINAGATEVVLSAGTYTVPSAVAGKEITLSGAGDSTVMDFDKINTVSGASITFENMKIQGRNANDNYGFGIQHTTGDIVFKNCTLTDAITNEYYGNVSYIGCRFTGTYYITTYSVKSATFENCVFDRTDSRALLVFSQGNNPVNVTIKNCEFKAADKGYTGSGAWTAAVEVDTTNISSAGTTVTIEGCTYDANYNGIVRDKSTAGKENAVITVDGVTVVNTEIKTTGYAG